MEIYDSPEYTLNDTLRGVQIDPDDDQLEINTRVNEALEPFKSAFGKTSLGRSLFKTKKGYIGLGPSDIQEGDRMMMIAGVYVPYNFRKTDKAVVN
jgi:hypothetical protein